MNSNTLQNKLKILSKDIRHIIKHGSNDVEHIHDLRTQSREILSLIDKQNQFYAQLKKVLKLSNEMRDIDVFLEVFIPSLPNKYSKNLHFDQNSKIFLDREEDFIKLVSYLQQLIIPEDLFIHTDSSPSEQENLITSTTPEFEQKALHKYRIFIKKMMYKTKNTIPQDKAKLKHLTKIKDLLGHINDNFNGIERLKTLSIDSILFDEIQSYIEEQNQKYFHKIFKLNDTI